MGVRVCRCMTLPPSYNPQTWNQHGSICRSSYWKKVQNRKFLMGMSQHKKVKYSLVYFVFPDHASHLKPWMWHSLLKILTISILALLPVFDCLSDVLSRIRGALFSFLSACVGCQLQRIHERAGMKRRSEDLKVVYPTLSPFTRSVLPEGFFSFCS